MTRLLLVTAAVGVAMVVGQQSPVRAWSVLEEGVKSTTVETRIKAIRSLGLTTNNARS